MLVYIIFSFPKVLDANLILLKFRWQWRQAKFYFSDFIIRNLSYATMLR